MSLEHDAERGDPENLAAFITTSPSPYHAVDECRRVLEAAGFERSLHEAGSATPDRGFVVDGGLLIAWNRHGRPDGAPLRCIATHTDSPNLRIRPNPDHRSDGWDQLGVEVYGGALLNSWLDRDLGLSGRVAVAERGAGSPTVGTRLFRIDRPLLRVPQLAIHLDRDIGSGLVLDRQRHLQPVWALDGDAPSFRSFLAEEIGVDDEDVLAWDAMTHDLTPPVRLGVDHSLLAAPRLDNLCSTWSAITALVDRVDEPSDSVAVVVATDHEEVGSVSSTGAASHRLASVLGLAGGPPPPGSALMSADMAHGVHPNHPDRHEPDHRIVCGGGPAVKINSNQRYASDAPSIGLLAVAAERAEVPLQRYSHRGDLPCGSTVGPTLSAGLAMPTVDVGAPQLSMHSARELMAAADIGPYRRLMEAWISA